MTLIIGFLTLHRYELLWLQIARSTVLSAALYNLIDESELLTSRSTAYISRDSMMIEFALGYGGTKDTC